jgi:hypothetical protein
MISWSRGHVVWPTPPGGIRDSGVGGCACDLHERHHDQAALTVDDGAVLGQAGLGRGRGRLPVAMSVTASLAWRAATGGCSQGMIDVGLEGLCPQGAAAVACLKAAT